MKGLMQDWPLLVSTILDHAALNHAEREVVTRTVEGSIHRYTYADLSRRAKQVAQALLDDLSVSPGDRIATLAWNTYRHIEAWYGIAGIGAVCHTLNPRLFAEQIAWIANHAEDRYIFVDISFVSILEQIQDQLTSVQGFIIMTDRAHMPETTLRNVHCYEELVADRSSDFDWPRLDENTACGLCYTSGTTGNPKGVLYSHRSNVLHALTNNNADALGLRSVDCTMPVVPMFHANAWAVVYAAPMTGAKLVLPGPKMDPESIYELLTAEAVTCTAAVPTVWLQLLQYLDKTKQGLPYLERVVIGGSAAPRSMIERFQRDFGVHVDHAWGMTEMSPLGTIGAFKSGMDNFSEAERLDIQTKQGRPPYLVEMKIVDDDNRDLPRDGKTYGHLKVRGPTIAKAYFKGEGGEILDENGWFDTGDVATIDPLGYMQITDRAKDVIKSGGEWISSIELENLAVGHPDVAEAAVIGVAHPKWDERPLLIVVPKEGRTLDKAALLGFFEGRIAKWWMPDDVVVVPEIPHTATGKIQKTALREQFKDYQLPTAKAAE